MLQTAHSGTEPQCQTASKKRTQIAPSNAASRTPPLPGPTAKPRLAYLTNQYPAVSHTFIFHEVQELRSLGFEILTASVNACDRSGAELPPREQIEKSATFYVKPSGISGAIGAVVFSLIRCPGAALRGLLFTLGLGGTPVRWFYFVEALILGRWLKNNRLSHLHVHFGTAAASVGMIAARAFEIPLSLTIHGPDEFYEVSRNYLPQKIETARFVCCIGNFARSQLMKICPIHQWNKLKLSPLGVDPVHFAPLNHRQNPEIFEVLCVGRLVPAKGQHILLSAIKLLVSEGRAVRLRLVGDGPDRKELEQRLAKEGLRDSVVLVGAMNQDRILEFLQTADAVVLASFAEGIPVALMEAMAMEIPCISTSVAGIPELISSGITGLLVAPSDDGQLAAAIKRLMDDPHLRQRLGASARAFVVENFNLRKNVQKLAEIYECHIPVSS